MWFRNCCIDGAERYEDSCILPEKSMKPVGAQEQEYGRAKKPGFHWPSYRDQGPLLRDPLT